MAWERKDIGVLQARGGAQAQAARDGGRDAAHDAGGVPGRVSKHRRRVASKEMVSSGSFGLPPRFGFQIPCVKSKEVNYCSLGRLGYHTSHQTALGFFSATGTVTNRE